MSKAKTKSTSKTKDKDTQLTARQMAFVLNYATIGSETYHNGRKSAIAAGYSEKSAGSTASLMLRRESTLTKIADLEAQQLAQQAATAGFKLAWLQGEFARLAKKAEMEGSLSEARANLEALGKTMGAFKDNISVDVAERQQYTEREQLEGRRLARMLIMSNPTMLGQVVDIEDGDSTQHALDGPRMPPDQRKLESGVQLPIQGDKALEGNVEPPEQAERERAEAIIANSVAGNDSHE